jgi:hypothetical protein
MQVETDSAGRMLEMANTNEGLAKTRLQYEKAAEGIRNPTATILKPDEDLYRFTSSRIPGSGAAMPAGRQTSGPWWFRSRDWQKILKTYLKSPFRLGTVARFAGAVQWSWSDMDVLLKARVVHGIEVWEGTGLPQYRDILPNGMAVTLEGFPDVVQLFIPGMPDSARALRLVDRLSVASSTSRGDGIGGPYGEAR